MDWQKLVQTALELAGVIEKKDTAVRRRLAAINQTKPPGSVTVVLTDVGPKKISAVTAVRKVTGLNLEDVLTLVETMLPIPILTHVDRDTAEIARKLIEAMGASVRLVETSSAKPVPANRRQERDPDQKSKTINATPIPLPEPVQAEGDYVVILQNAGLLPERISQITRGLTGWGQEETETAVADLPQPILLGVNETAAYKAQRELQMLGAVVDVLLWADYDAG